MAVLVATPAFHQYKSQSETLEAWLADIETRVKEAEGDPHKLKVGGSGSQGHGTVVTQTKGGWQGKVAEEGSRGGAYWVIYGCYIFSLLI